MNDHKKLLNKKRKPIIVGVILLIVVFIFMGLYYGFGKDVLKGTWDLDGTTVYQFNGRGKGSLVLPIDTYSFTYEIVDQEVHIDFQDEQVRDMTYTFSVEDDQLTFTNREKKEVKIYVLTKKK